MSFGLTRQTVLLAIFALLVGGAVTYAFAGGGPDERTRELEATVDSLSGELAQARRALVVVDSTAAVEIREARSRRARQDTVFRASVDTIRAALPDTLRPALDRLVRADSIEDAAYEAEIAALESKVEARDSVIARLEAQTRAQAELVAHLKNRLDPPLLKRVFGSVGEGFVRAGVVGLAVAVDRPEAAAGAAGMWAVEVAF